MTTVVTPKHKQRPIDGIHQPYNQICKRPILKIPAETVEKGSVSGNILNFAIYDFQFSFKLFLSMSKNSSAIFLQISYYFLLN